MRSSTLSGSTFSGVVDVSALSSFPDLAPLCIAAGDPYDTLGVFAVPQFGGGDQPVDDIGRALDAVTDESRLAIGTGDEQGRRIAVDAVAEADGVEGDAGADDGVARFGSA